jgi:hypothetical protein
MRKGLPFETDDFMALRERQRRELRLVPDWVMERNSYVPEPHERQPDALVEQELRRLADEAKDSLPGELASRFGEFGRAEAKLPRPGPLSSRTTTSRRAGESRSTSLSGVGYSETGTTSLG